MGGDLEDALEEINVPSYVIDSSGVIRWLNPAARRIVGDRVGHHFTSVVVPEETAKARNQFAQKLLGTAPVADTPFTLIGADGGEVTVELSSVPLRRGGRVVGVFGQASDVTRKSKPPVDLQLTPRQAEILRLLERGRSTAQIAEDLHVSRETVRNHVRHLLRAVGVSSRLEAVAVARGEVLVS
jgi:PAS domain S-box-containing protein